MPSRRLREACPKCNKGNPVRSKFCSQCGAALEIKPRMEDPAQARQAEHRDIAHPINPEFREYLQTKVLGAYEEEARGGGTSAPASGSVAAPAAAPAAGPVDDTPIGGDPADQPLGEDKPLDADQPLSSEEPPVV